MTKRREMPEQTDTLTLSEEVATVSKETVGTGRVRVRTVTDTVQQAVGASLESEAYEVTRVAIDREVDVPPITRTEGDLTIIPVLEEVLFIEKRLVLKEEIHLRRRTSSDKVDSHVMLRRQRALVEQVETAGGPIEANKPKEKP